MGSVGTLANPIAIGELIQQVKTISGADVVRSSVASSSERRVQRIALLGGSGSSFYRDAVQSGADLFVTGDSKYHAFHAANDQIPLIDPGHAETERFVVPGMASLVRDAVSATAIDVPVIEIEQETNPVHYIC
jgi:putative NIF3 family GTP cyclohydrolase 1 type 2